MTTRYRVEYALKTHRRDQLIEWIKGLLAVPFVLHSQPTGVFESRDGSVAQMAGEAHRRYAEILKDVEEMINDHIAHQDTDLRHQSKLKLLVPSVGTFFTTLHLEAAFKYQDRKRLISFRRFVPPSFNDVRLILNTAQIMGVSSTGHLELATFDGDVTLYDDGESLEPTNELKDKANVESDTVLMKQNTKIGIVTAAGYAEAERYHSRLHGLLESIKDSDELTFEQKHNLVVMGGESNYLYAFDIGAPHLLAKIPRRAWILDSMHAWTEPAIQALLNRAEAALRECVAHLRMDATVLRKERAVGIVPATPGSRFPRESLEETVLVVQKMLEMSEEGRRVPFCAFNGGNDVFVDIGDKSWGVLVCQKYFGSRSTKNTPPPMEDGETSAPPTALVDRAKTLHVGDQFLSAGSNDFKARSVGTTAWIANPHETVELLDDMRVLLHRGEHGFKDLDNWLPKTVDV